MDNYNIPEHLWKHQLGGRDWVDVSVLVDVDMAQDHEPYTIKRREATQDYWRSHPNYDPSCRCIWRYANEEKPQSPKENYVTLDSGNRRSWSTGARRDVDGDKPRYDLLPTSALRRWAELLGRGANKYGDRNWEKGMPVSVFVASALRHLYSFLEGDRREDHLAAILFNIGGIIEMERLVAENQLPSYYLDEGASTMVVADQWATRIRDVATASRVLLSDIRFRHGDIYITTPDQHLVITAEAFVKYTDAELADLLTGKKTVV